MSKQFANHVFTGGAFLTLGAGTGLVVLGTMMTMEEVTPRGLVVLATAAECWAAAGTILLSVTQVTERGLAPLLNLASRVYGILGLFPLIWALLLPNW